MFDKSLSLANDGDKIFKELDDWSLRVENQRCNSEYFS